MEIRKLRTYTSDIYAITDGPVVDTESGHLTQGQFKADYMAVTTLDGELEKVYVKGQQITSKGTLGKNTRSRTFFSDYPVWVLKFLKTI
jgi:hypothetical protein